MSKKRTQRLAIYLLKDTLPSPEAAVKTAGTTRHEVSFGGVSAIVYCC